MAKQLNIDLNVRANTGNAKQQFLDLQKSLTDIATSASKVGNIAVNDNSLRIAAGAAQELSKHLQSAVNVDTGKLDLNKLNVSLKKSNTDIGQLSSKLLNAGNSGQKAFAQLAQSIAAADRPIIKLSSRLSGFLTTLKNTARWQISSSILHGFMGAIQSAYGYAQDLNESLNNIRIVTGYSVDKMADFAVEANKAAKALSTTTTEYTNASLIYYQQGLSDAEVKARTDATIKLANVSRQSAEEVSNQMTAVWNNFAEGADNLEYYIDVMAKLGATTASSTQEIATGLEKFAAVASTVGLSYEYATAALATVTAQTRQSAEIVGTAFKTLFARLQDLELGETLEDGTTLGKYSAALQVVGVNIKDINGQVKDMDQILDELGSKWNQISKDQQIALAQTVAGTRQYTQLIALMDNWDVMQKNLGTVANANGELDRQAKIYAESWEAARDRVKASLESIYSDLLDDSFFIDISNGFAKILNGVHEFLKGIGGIKGVLIAVGGFFLSSIAGKITPAIQNLKISLTGMLQGPQKQAEKYSETMQKVMMAAREKLGFNLEGADQSTKTAILNAEQLATAKNKLMVMDSKLSPLEKQLAESQLELIQIQQNEVQMLADKVTAEREALEATMDGMTAEAAIAELEKSRKEELGGLIQLEREAKAAYDQASGFADIIETARAYEEAKQAVIDYEEQTMQLAATEENLVQALRNGYESILQTESAVDATNPLIIDLGQYLTETANGFNDIATKASSMSKGQIIKSFQDLRQQVSQLGLEELPEVKKALNDVLSNKSATKNDLVKKLQNISNVLRNLKVDANSSKQQIAALRKLLVSFGDGKNVETMEKGYKNLAKTTNQLTKAQQQYNNAIQNFNPTHMLTASESFARLAGAGMQTAMVINSVKSAINALNSEDMSPLEKFTTVLMSIGMIVPSVIGVISNFSAVVQGLNTAMEAHNIVVATTAAVEEMYAATTEREALVKGLSNAATTKDTAAKIANTVATKLNFTAEQQSTLQTELENIAKEKGTALTFSDIAAAIAHTAAKGGEATGIMGTAAAWLAEAVAAITAQTAMSPLLAITLLLVAALALLAVAIMGIIALFNLWKNSSPEGQLENAKQATEDAAKAADKAKDAYQALKDTIDKYENARDKIDELTKGTDEFREAVEEANDAARELIRQYKLTKFTVDANGVIQLDNQELQDKKKELANQVRIAEANYVGTQNYQREKEDNITRSKMTTKAKTYSTMWATDENGYTYNTNQYLTGKNIQKVQMALGTGDFTGQTKESIMSAMGWSGELTTAQEDFINSLLKAGDSLSEFGDALIENANASTAATKALLAADMAENEEFLNSNNQNAILETQMRKEKDVEAAVDKEISKMSMDDLYDAYAKAMGYGSHGIGGWLDGKERFYDANGQQVADLTDEQVKEYYKAIRKAQEMENGAEEAIAIVGQTIQAAGENSNLVSSVLAGETSSDLKYGQAHDSSLLDSLTLTDEEAQALGYADAQAYKDALAENLQNTREAWEKIDTEQFNLPDEVLNGMSLETAKSLEGVFNKIKLGPMGEQAAQDFSAGLNKMLDGLSAKDSQAALQQLVNVDWSNWDALEDVDAILQQFGKDIDTSSEEWQSFAISMRIAAGATPDFSKLKDNLAEITAIVQKLDFGSIISDEDYERLMAYNDEWSKFFITLADGTRKFIGDQTVLSSATRDQIREDRKVLAERAAAQTGFENANWGIRKDNGDWQHWSGADWIKYSENGGVGGAENLMNASGATEDMLNILGYTDDVISDLVNKAKNGTEEEKETALAALREMYRRVGEFQQENLDEADKQLDEMLASTANSLDELLALKDEISRESYDKQLSVLAMQAKSLEELQRIERAGIQEGNVQAALDTYEYGQALLKLGESFDNAQDECVKYNEALLTGDITQIKAAQSALELAIQTGELAKKYSLDAQTTENYSKRLAESFKEQGVNAQAATKLGLQVAIANQRLDRGLLSLNENLEDYKTKLKTANKGSAEWSATMDALKDNLADILNVDVSTLTDIFSEAALESKDLEKALDGDVEAIKRLQATAAEEMMLSIKTNLEGADLREFTDQWEYLKANMAEAIETPGIDQSNLINSFNEMIKAGNMTKEQIETALAGLHVSANVKTDYIAQKVTVPTTITEQVRYISGYDDIDVNADGKTIKVARWRTETNTFNGPPHEVDGYVPQYTIEGTTGPGNITTGFISAPAPKASFSSTKSGGAGGKSGGGGGGESKTPEKKETKNPTDEKDRYHVIREQLDDLSKAYDRISKAKDRAFGANKLAGIKAEQKALKDQIAAQDEYLKQIEEMNQYDINNLQHGKEKGFAMDGNWYAINGLSSYGITAQLDENGVLINYDQIVEAAVAKYNEAVAYYNGLSAEMQEQDKSLEFAENQYQGLMDLLAQYEETNNLLQDEMDKRQDLFYEWQDNNMEALSYEIELKLKINDNDLKWLEYQMKKIGDNVYKTSEAIANLFSQNGISQADVAVQSMNDLLEHMNKLDAAYKNGEISEAAYFEALEETRDGMYEQLEAMMAIDEQMEEYYSDTLSKVNEELDKFTERMRHNIDVVNHMKDILELSGRGQDYAAMGSLLNANMQQTGDVYQTSKERYEMMLAQEQEAEARLQEALQKGGKEEQEIAQKNYDAAIEARQEAENTMYEDWKAHLEACNAVMENELDKMKKGWDDLATGGKGWDYLEQTMDLASRIGDKYLTKTNQIYETNKMLRTLQQDIDKTTNKAAQQKLNNFAKEIQSLQEIGELSKDNLEIAKAQYEVLKAEIALEEAQNAKSTVRLQRDNEGNYGYVYTADQDKVNDAKQALEDKRNNLYNLALEQENNNAQEILEITKERNEALRELYQQYYVDKTITEEEWQNRSLEIKEKYDNLLEATTKNHLVAREILNQESITGENDSWTKEYEDLVQKNYACINQQDEFWRKGFGAITTQRTQWFSTEGPAWDSFYQGIMTDATNTQKTWTQELETMKTNTQTAMNTFNSAVGIDEKTGTRGTLLNLENKLKDVTGATTDYKNKLTGDNGLISTLGKEASAVQTSTTNWGKYYDKLKGKGGVISAVEEAIQKINALIKAASTNANATYTTTYVTRGTYPQPISDQNATYTTTYKTNNGDSGGGDKSTNPGGQDKGSKVKVDSDRWHDAKDYKRHYKIIYYKWSKTGEEVAGSREKVYENHIFKIAGKNSGSISYYCDACGFGYIHYPNGNDAYPYDTGGYTGEWAGGSQRENGKLAFLHQKELVLNEDDTKNMLQSVSLVRQLSQMIDLQALMSGVSTKIHSPSVLDNSQSLEQMVTIHAEFPNAINHNEIEEAFTNLVNKASQYAYRSKK